LLIKLLPRSKDLDGNGGISVPCGKGSSQETSCAIGNRPYGKPKQPDEHGKTKNQALTSDQEILDQVEVEMFYAQGSSIEQDVASRQVGRLLLEYIDSAWTDDQKLESLSTELTALVSQSIERSRKEKIAELEANELPSIQGSDNQPEESEDLSSGVPVPPSTGKGTTMPREVVERDLNHSMATSILVGNNTELVHKAESDLELHRYTSLIWEHYSKIGGSVPEFKDEQLCLFPARWRCTATFAGSSASGEGRSTKMAKHVASRQLYNKLGISG
jgi:hypothetical protein